MSTKINESAMPFPQQSALVTTIVVCTKCTVIFLWYY